MEVINKKHITQLEQARQYNDELEIAAESYIKSAAQASEEITSLKDNLEATTHELLTTKDKMAVITAKSETEREVLKNLRDDWEQFQEEKIDELDEERKKNKLLREEIEKLQFDQKRILDIVDPNGKRSKRCRTEELQIDDRRPTRSISLGRTFRSSQDQDMMQTSRKSGKCWGFLYYREFILIFSMRQVCS